MNQGDDKDATRRVSENRTDKQRRTIGYKQSVSFCIPPYLMHTAQAADSRVKILINL